MAAPDHVPGRINQPKVYASPPQRSGGWVADRPGEVVGTGQPSGPMMGHPGPDQGYVMKLARQLAPELVLAPGEDPADVLEGACAVALRRASIFGRAPVIGDVEIALGLFGFLSDADDELVAFRRPLFDELHHTTIHYARARELADLVPEATLRMSPDAVAAASAADWRAPLGL